MALEIWYSQRPAADSGPGNGSIIVSTVQELDAFVDRVLIETKDHAVPSIAEIAIAGDWKRGVLDVGLGQERGFVHLMTRDGGWTKGDPSLAGDVVYDYMAHASEIPASAEIPIGVVRQALREFLETGEKPTSVEWQEAE